jgi:hypothetical protein
VIAAEQAAQLDRLLRILPVRQRDILTLRIVVGLSAVDTAHALGTTAGAVRVAQHRALQRLRRQLAIHPTCPTPPPDGSARLRLGLPASVAVRRVLTEPADAVERILEREAAPLEGGSV